MSNSSFQKSSISTPVSVANGGTGVATLGDAGVLIGNGTGVVQVTGAGTSGQILTSNGAGVDPTFQSVSTVLSGIAPHQTFNYQSVVPTAIPMCMQTAYEANNGYIYIGFYSGTSAYLTKWIRDASGTYYMRFNVTMSVALAAGNIAFNIIVPDNGYVYLNYQKSAGDWEVRRFDESSLGNETLMTISGTAVSSTSQNAGAFYDGTYFYYNDNVGLGAGRRYYSLSGTTLTYVGTVTQANTVTYPYGSFYCDGTDVWQLISSGTIDIQENPINSASTTIHTRNLVNSVAAEDFDGHGGLAYWDATTFLVGITTQIYDEGAITNYILNVFPVTKP